LLFRHAPQSEQAEALLAAQASMAAHSQGKFWEFHDRLFDRPDALGAAALRNHAVALGLDLERFDKNLREETFLGQINRDRDLADQLQLTVNPTLFINGRLIEGSRTYEELKEVVESCRTQASKLQAQGAPTAGYYEYLMELAPRDTETPPAP
jgi:protein-disulfide isomerase